MKSLLARKLRLLLTALSIVLGIGFVAGTFVLTDTMDRAFDELFDHDDGRHRCRGPRDVGVRAGSRQPGRRAETISRNPIPTICCSVVQEVPGVGSAYGGVLGYAQMVDPDDRGGDRRLRATHDRRELAGRIERPGVPERRASVGSGRSGDRRRDGT